MSKTGPSATDEVNREPQRGWGRDVRGSQGGANHLISLHEKSAKSSVEIETLHFECQNSRHSGHNRHVYRQVMLWIGQELPLHGVAFGQKKAPT